jgi:hypothetical protein
VSSITTEAPRTDTTGAHPAPAVPDTVTRLRPVASREGALTPDQRRAVRRRLLDLAELEEHRVERVATLGPEALAAYDLGVRDEVEGDRGADRIFGNRGNDELEGGPRGDRIFGNVGNDDLEGDRGNDRLVGGRGFDDAEGGPGNDVCFAEERESC